MRFVFSKPFSRLGYGSVKKGLSNFVWGFGLYVSVAGFTDGCGRTIDCPAGEFWASSPAAGDCWSGRGLELSWLTEVVLEVRVPTRIPRRFPILGNYHVMDSRGGLMFFRRSLTSPGATQRLQYPSIMEYTLNYSRDPSMIKGIFLT